MSFQVGEEYSLLPQQIDDLNKLKGNNTNGVEKITNNAMQQVLEKKIVNGDVTISQIAKEGVKFKASENALNDNAFMDEVGNIIKTDIKRQSQAELEINRIKSESEKLENEAREASNYHDKHKPILEFVGVDKPVGLSTMKWLFYIFVLTYISVCIFIKFPFNVVKTFFNCINEVVLCIKTFSRQAVWVVIICLVLILIYVLLVCIQGWTGVKILPF